MVEKKNKKGKIQRRGGRKQKNVVYEKPELEEYNGDFQITPQIYENGEPAPVYRWGSLYLYDARKGSGGRNQFNKFKVGKDRRVFRLWGGSNYDQIDKLEQKQKNEPEKQYIKTRMFAVENLTELVECYKAKNWTNVIEYLGVFLAYGKQVHMMYGPEDRKYLDELKEVVKEEYVYTRLEMDAKKQEIRDANEERLEQWRTEYKPEWRKGA